jgi:hypothetical protein
VVASPSASSVRPDGIPSSRFLQWLGTASVARARYLKDALALVPSASAVLIFSKRFLGPPLGYDEQFFVWGGWSILKGLVPYKDFLEHKPPMVFVTHAVALALFGFEGNRYRRFFVLFALVAILAWQVALLTRSADRWLTAALGTALAYLFVNPAFHDTSLTDSESIGLSYYFLGVAFLLAKTPYQRAFDIMGGVFLSLCVLSKEPFVPCILPTWAACFLARDDRSLRGRAPLHYLRDTGIGVAGVIVACLLYMVPSGSLGHYLAMLQRYRVMFRDPDLGYCAVLGIFRPRGFWEDLPRQWDIVSNTFFNLKSLGFLLPIMLGALVFTWARSKALFFAGVASVVGALYATTISNCYWMHYYNMAQTGLFLFLSLGVVSMKSRWWPWPSRYWALLVAIVPIAVTVWPTLKAEYAASYPSYPPGEPLPGLFAFIAENSTPADRIFTTGPPGLYIVTDRIAATRTSSVTDEIIASFPGNTDQEKLRPLYEDLATRLPKIVVLDPEHGDRKRRYLAAAIYPFLEDFHYRKVRPEIYERP